MSVRRPAPVPWFGLVVAVLVTGSVVILPVRAGAATSVASSGYGAGAGVSVPEQPVRPRPKGSLPERREAVSRLVASGRSAVAPGPAAVPVTSVRTLAVPDRAVASGTDERRLWAWGRNDTGQLGDGSTTSRPRPVRVGALSTLASATGGARTGYALLTGGDVLAWGSNEKGLVGDGSTTDRTTPAKVSGIAGATEVEAGSDTAHALLSNGTIAAWGGELVRPAGERIDDGPAGTGTGQGREGRGRDRCRRQEGQCVRLCPTSGRHGMGVGIQRYGHLGDGTTTDRLSPVRVHGLSGVTAIAAGDGNGYALRADGSVRAWGRNDFGQLGDGSTTSRLEPVRIAGLSNIARIASSQVTAYALRSDGVAWAWGDNYWGQIGDGTTTTRNRPVRLTGLDPVRSIAGGYSTTFAVVGTPAPAATLASGQMRGCGGCVVSSGRQVVQARRGAR